MSRVIVFDPAELQAVGLPALRNDPCDYCQTGVPTWRYPARDISLGTVVSGPIAVTPVAVDDWMACDICSGLIEAGDWPALARRTLAAADLARAAPGTRVRLLAQIRFTHEQFRKARNGPRERVA